MLILTGEEELELDIKKTILIEQELITLSTTKYGTED
jgi:hypothetical protein